MRVLGLGLDRKDGEIVRSASEENDLKILFGHGGEENQLPDGVAAEFNLKLC